MCSRTPVSHPQRESTSQDSQIVDSALLEDADCKLQIVMYNLFV